VRMWAQPEIGPPPVPRFARRSHERRSWLSYPYWGPPPWKAAENVPWTGLNPQPANCAYQARPWKFRKCRGRLSTALKSLMLGRRPAVWLCRLPTNAKTLDYRAFHRPQRFHQPQFCPSVFLPTETRAVFRTARVESICSQRNRINHLTPLMSFYPSAPMLSIRARSRSEGSQRPVRCSLSSRFGTTPTSRAC
jgi:hypothetical protein